MTISYDRLQKYRKLNKYDDAIKALQINLEALEYELHFDDTQMENCLPLVVVKNGKPIAFDELAIYKIIETGTWAELELLKDIDFVKTTMLENYPELEIEVQDSVDQNRREAA